MSISCLVFYDFLIVINRVDLYCNMFFFDDFFLIFVGVGKCDMCNFFCELGLLIMKMVYIEF